MHRRRLPQTVRLLLASLALSAVATAQQPADASSATVSAAPYRVGEKLTYSVSFSNFQSAAHAETYVAGRGSYFDREGVELRAHVATIGVVSAALLRLNSYYFAFVDPRTGLPYRAHVEAGEATLPVEMQETAAAQPVDIVTTRTPAEAGAAAGAPDFVSALYRLRALPLAPGARFRFTAQHAGTQYDAELRVERRETVNTPAGSFTALAAQVRVRNNDSADDLRLRIHFTDDERRVPVLITARLRAGEVRAALASDETVLQPAPPDQVAAQPVLAQPLPTVLPPDPSRPNDGARPTPPVRPSPTPAGSASLAGLPFSVGEELNFNFYLGNATQPVGTASFQVRARGRYFNRDGLLLTARMSTNAALQRLFPVQDQINCYIDPATLLPFRTELQIQEGTHSLRGTVSLDQERGAAVAHDGTRLEIPVGTYDLVSILYALRSFDLAPPKRNAVALLLNKRPRTLHINSVSREMIDLGGQRVSAYQLALSTDDPQGNSLNLRLWVGTDRRRLPLRITATTPLGPVRGELAIIPLTRQ